MNSHHSQHFSAAFARTRTARTLASAATVVALLAMTFGVTATVLAENWAEWRGPQRNAVSSETGLPTNWSAETGIRWKAKLPGQGVSSPVIWGDRIFLTAADGPAQDELYFVCLALADGKELWRLRLWGTSPTLHHATKSDMATPTPVTDGKHIYALFGTGDVFCVDVDGGLVWQRSLASEYGPFENRFGHTSSPAVQGDLLFLQCDHYGESYVLALDRHTGENRWKLDRPGVWHSWSSPQLLIDQPTGNGELLVCAATRLDALEPQTGKPLWTVSGLQRECIPTPVTGHGLIFAVSGPKGTAMAIRPGGRGDVSESHVVWRSQRGSPYVPSPVLVGDHYYIVDDQGILTCLDAHSGKLAWQKRLRGAFTASPIAGDGKVFFTNDDGETTVVQAHANAYVELARNTLGEPVYASGAISHGCLFFRTPHHLVCIATTNAANAEEPKPAATELPLFDFEEPADIQAWSNLELPDAKLREPPAKFERSTDHATSGQHSLKITFAGGRWPTLTTTHVPEDWMPYWTFHADVTVSRPCVVGFTVLQEKSQRGGGWDATVSRWTKTEFLKPGRNAITGSIHDSNNYSINEKNGKVVRFEIFMYSPHDGETIYVDNLRLSAAKENKSPVVTKFQVAGTDLFVSGVRELGQKLKDRWTKPEPKSLEQVEREFRAQYDELKQQHPRAVLAVLRDGELGFDPTQPQKVFSGWKDAYWSSHGPDGMTVERTTNTGREASHEIFMRHRSPLMRVDLASIPPGSNILAARLIVIRNHDQPVKEHNPDQPNMWVVEPCNRPWEEYEVNAYEFAKDKFWKAIGGGFYGNGDGQGDSDTPDFLPLYLAHGPSQGKVNTWDFTHAVRFWTAGQHLNNGFMLHGDAGDWLPRAHSREAKEIQDRPAVLVIYEPK